MKSVHSLEENSSSRPRLVMVAFLLSIGLLATAPSAQAISFDFTSDHVTGGAGTPPFGTVTLTQVGTSVDVTVHLATGYSFVKTGSADFQNFKFNATGVTLSDITIIQNHQPFVLLPATGAFNGDGTGNFAFGISDPVSPNGGAGAFAGDIVFFVANATIADLTAPNNLGNLFVADILAPNGNTGPVDVTAPSVPDSGSTVLLLGLGLFGICFAKKVQRPESH